MVSAVVAVTVMHVLLFLLYGCARVTAMLVCGPGEVWLRELGLGFANPVGTGGVLDMCLCFGCGGVGGEWVGGLDQGRERWGGVMSV